MLTALLGAVAAVSLLVGGIGIMNIILVSITEGPHLLTVVALTAQLSGAVGSGANFSGSWVLDQDRGEEPAFELVGFDAPPELLAPEKFLTIDITDTSVMIIGADRARRFMRLSGAPDEMHVRGLPVMATARMDGRILRLELSPGPELTVIQDYTVDPVTNRLSVRLRTLTHGREGRMTIWYVYDRAKG